MTHRTLSAELFLKRYTPCTWGQSSEGLARSRRPKLSLRCLYRATLPFLLLACVAANTARAEAPAFEWSQQPVNWTGYQGDTVSFTAAAVPEPGITYQWYAWSHSNWMFFGGATSSTLRFTAGDADSPQYQCRATKDGQTITSNTVSETLSFRWSQQPVNLNEPYGTAASFTATATGTQNIAYQWYRNYVAITGATSTTLGIGLDWTNDLAIFYCTATHQGHTIESNHVQANVTSYAVWLPGSGYNWCGSCWYQSGQGAVDTWPTVQTTGTRTFPRIGKLSEGMNQPARFRSVFVTGENVPPKAATSAIITSYFYKYTTLEPFTLKAYLTSGTAVTPPGLGLLGSVADTAIDPYTGEATISASVSQFSTNPGATLNVLWTTAGEEAGSWPAPENAGSYAEPSRTGSIYFTFAPIPTQIPPTITWAYPADIVYGTALSGAQLNADAGIAGSYYYTPPAGTILPAGAGWTLRVDFFPSDTVNYTYANKDVLINVAKATPAITWANPADIEYDTPLGATQLDATASVPGVLSYTPPAGTVLPLGDGQTLHMDFVPTDTANYNSAGEDVTINVLKATPVITWANPADIVYGTALGATQLNATATVPGTLTYTPEAGTVLALGNGQILHVDFVPADTLNYENASDDVTVNVVQIGKPVITQLGSGDLLTFWAGGQFKADISLDPDYPPAITWPPVVGAMKYWFIFKDRTTGTYLEPGTELNQNSWSPAPLTPFHCYGAAVIAGNDFCWGPWSDWMNFLVGPASRPVPVPYCENVLLAATPPRVLDSNSPTITWTIDWDPALNAPYTAPLGSMHYLVGVYDCVTYSWVTGYYDPNTQTWVPVPIQQDESSWTPDAPLLTSHTYGICLAAGNDYTWGDWSDWVYFNIVSDAAPAAPVVYPSIFFIDSTTTPTIFWNTVDGADHYYLSIFDLNPLVWGHVVDVTLDPQPGPIQSWPVPENILASGSLYMVIIGASNQYGLTWGNWQQFHVGSYTPSQAPIIRPATEWPDTTGLVFGDFDGTWGCWVAPTPCTILWDYWGYDETDFHVTLSDETTNSYVTDAYGWPICDQSYGNWTATNSTTQYPFVWETPTLVPEHRYRFSVGAATGSTVAPANLWAVIDFVALDTKPPQGAPRITQLGYGPFIQLPNGLYAYDNAPVLPAITWTAVPGATYYGLYFRDWSSASPTYQTVSAPQTCWVPPAPLSVGGAYGVCILACNDFGGSRDANGNLVWSQVQWSNETHVTWPDGTSPNWMNFVVATDYLEIADPATGNDKLDITNDDLTPASPDDTLVICEGPDNTAVMDIYSEFGGYDPALCQIHWMITYDADGLLPAIDEWTDGQGNSYAEGYLPVSGNAPAQPIWTDLGTPDAVRQFYVFAWLDGDSSAPHRRLQVNLIKMDIVCAVNVNSPNTTGRAVMSPDMKTAIAVADVEVGQNAPNVIIFQLAQGSGTSLKLQCNGVDAQRLAANGYSTSVDMAELGRLDSFDRNNLWSIPWPSDNSDQTVKVVTTANGDTGIATQVSLVPRTFAPSIAASNMEDSAAGGSDATYVYVGYWIPWKNVPSTDLSSLQRPAAVFNVQLDAGVLAAGFADSNISVPVSQIQQDYGMQLFLAIPKAKTSMSLTISGTGLATFSKTVTIIDTGPPVVTTAASIRQSQVSEPVLQEEQPNQEGE